MIGRKNANASNGQEPEVEPHPPKPPRRQIEAVHAEAISKYCTDASQAILAIADEVMAMAESFVSESKALSDNMLKCAELERERTSQFYQNIRDSVRAVTAIRNTFERPYAPSKPSEDAILEAVQAAVEPEATQ
jgi:hypothetical protein